MPNKIRPPFLDWAIRVIINSRGDIAEDGDPVFTTEKSKNNFWVDLYFYKFPHREYGAY